MSYLEHSEDSTNLSFRYLPDCYFIHTLHSHPEFEITFIVNGEGERRVGAHKEAFQSGDLVMIGPNIDHYWAIPPAKRKNSSGRVINFTADAWGERLFEKPEFRILDSLFKEVGRGIRFIGKTAKIVGAMMTEMNKMDNLQKFIALFRILDLLQKSQEKVYLNEKNYAVEEICRDEFLSQIILFIKTKFACPQIDLEIEQTFDISITALSSKFINYTGKTYADYLRLYRFKKSKEFLVNTDLKVKDIAAQCGYSEKNISRVFKHLVDLTPKEYRKTIGNGTNNQEL